MGVSSDLNRFATILWLTVMVAGCSRERHVHNVTPEAFEAEVLCSDRPTVVEFWAHGCIPCMALARPLEKIARQYDGRVSFRKLNAGWTAQTRHLYRFDGVPTLIFYRDGHEVARQVGMPDGDVHKGLDAFVKAGLTAPSPPSANRDP
jgi:thioredoxin 1